MPAGSLVGREGEVQAIAGLLVGVRESGAALIVRGDAGYRQVSASGGGEEHGHEQRHARVEHGRRAD